jgi:hypothetical protein
VLVFVGSVFSAQTTGPLVEMREDEKQKISTKFNSIQHSIQGGGTRKRNPQPAPFSFSSHAKLTSVDSRQDRKAHAQDKGSTAQLFPACPTSDRPDPNNGPSALTQEVNGGEAMP